MSERLRKHDLYWPRLIQGTLIKRYNRFLADVKLRNGHQVTAHCPNSGSMQQCSETGRRVYLSRHNKPQRKLLYTWEMIQMPGSLVGVNTGVPNRLVRSAAESGKIPALAGYERIRQEVNYGSRSRIDLLLERGNTACFVEIKNCTLVERNTAYFPDAITSRGLKHLIELQREVKNGHRSVMFFLIQRMDAHRFEPAHHIDPEYGRELSRAAKSGVEILVYDVVVDLSGISLNRSIPLKMS
jgi:sugar fermentation stimulation protein A